MCGTRNPQSKFNDDDVLYIRKNYKPNDHEYGARALARKFNVDKNSILNIINYESYVNV